MSDASIIFYNTNQYIGVQDLEKLDVMLPYAFEIAEQIDKNFPLEKHV
jgi:hypothetical protein